MTDNMKGLSFTDRLQVRKALDKFIRGRDWMERKKKTVTPDQITRYYTECVDPFDKVWAEMLPKMSDDEEAEFHETLQTVTQAPGYRGPKVVLEKKGEKEEPIAPEKRIEDIRKKADKQAEPTKRKRRPKMKDNQGELF